MPTRIEWADETLQYATGCTRVSPACDNCYMFRDYPRLKAYGVPGYAAEPDQVALLPGRLDQLEEKLRTMRTGKKWFLNSMSDTFHRDVPFDLTAKAVQLFVDHPEHTWLMLTKRVGRMAYFWNHVWEGPVPSNVWVGTTVEEQRYAPRLDVLARIPAAVRWVSAEPLLGPLDLTRWLLPKWWHCDCCGAVFPDIDGHDCKECGGLESWTGIQVGDGAINWLVVGGESGDKARPMHNRWALDVMTRAMACGVATFFKQWGEWLPVGALPKLHPRSGNLLGPVQMVDGYQYQKLHRKAQGDQGKTFHGEWLQQYPEVANG